MSKGFNKRVHGLARRCGARRATAAAVAVAALLGFGCTQLGPLAAGASASGPGGSGGSGGGGITGTATTPTATTPTGPSTTTGTTSTPTDTTAPVPTTAPGAANNPFSGRGMWIWILADTDGGDIAQIVSSAQRLGIRTLMIKSADGTTQWPQFNTTLVNTLHAAHLKVCAWQYVYGQHPILEAQAAVAAVRDGADCLVIDAEVQYQGLYVQAQRYIAKLRSLIGANFPVALAGFPWIDYHPSFPYSIFLGPGGAQYNTPQMYWQDIGVSVADVYAHTYEYNELYQRPIDPLGQLFSAPPAKQIRLFRAVSRAYGARGVSWWDWQDASLPGLDQTAAKVGALTGFTAATTVASLGFGSAGDVVVWAQEHLLAAGETVAIDGSYGSETELAVETFQQAHQLAVTGVINPATWDALLAYRTPSITWSVRKHRLNATVTPAIARRARRAGSALVLPVPRSASLPARGNELHGVSGAGGPVSDRS